MAAVGEDIFVYMGGEQRVPRGVTHILIDPSVKIVGKLKFWVFWYRERLVSVIFHDGVEIIEEQAFWNCFSLSGGIKLIGVREIGQGAFSGCAALTVVEFGDRLETIGIGAFSGCASLRSIKSLSARIVQPQAFSRCEQLAEAEFGIDLEFIGFNSFCDCPNLRRVAIPLKYNLFQIDPIERRYTQFHRCDNLTTVEIVGAEGLHKTISSLHLKNWRDDMSEEIDRINQELPNTFSCAKTGLIQRWIRSVINRMEHYKAEHNRLLKEHMILLELAIWKTKLDEKEDNCTQKVQAERAKIDEERARGEKRITSGADIIIKNVIPFLKLA